MPAHRGLLNGCIDRLVLVVPLSGEQTFEVRRATALPLHSLPSRGSAIADAASATNAASTTDAASATDAASKNGIACLPSELRRIARTSATGTLVLPPRAVLRPQLGVVDDEGYLTWLGFWRPGAADAIARGDASAESDELAIPIQTLEVRCALPYPHPPPLVFALRCPSRSSVRRSTQPYYVLHCNSPRFGSQCSLQMERKNGSES